MTKKINSVCNSSDPNFEKKAPAVPFYKWFQGSWPEQFKARAYLYVYSNLVSNFTFLAPNQIIAL